MKFLQNDVVLLLTFIILFCFGLGFLRNDKQDIFLSLESLDPYIPEKLSQQTCDLPEEVDQKNGSSDLAVSNVQVVQPVASEHSVAKTGSRLSDLSTEQLIAYMKPLFMTKSASAIISFLQHIPADSVLKIVRAIVQDKTNRLPNRVKYRIIFAAAQRQRTRRAKFAYFDLIAHDKSLQKGVKPLLVKAVEAGYSHLVHDIVAWSETVDLDQDISRQAWLYAARHDDEDPEALRELFEAGVPVDSSLATELLCELMTHSQEGYSVAFLTDVLGADIGRSLQVAQETNNLRLEERINTYVA